MSSHWMPYLKWNGKEWIVKKEELEWPKGYNSDSLTKPPHNIGDIIEYRLREDLPWRKREVLEIYRSGLSYTENNYDKALESWLKDSSFKISYLIEYAPGHKTIIYQSQLKKEKN